MEAPHTAVVPLVCLMTGLAHILPQSLYAAPSHFEYAAPSHFDNKPPTLSMEAPHTVVVPLVCLMAGLVHPPKDTKSEKLSFSGLS
jgi:hypothetical protein